MDVGSCTLVNEIERIEYGVMRWLKCARHMKGEVDLLKLDTQSLTQTKEARS